MFRFARLDVYIKAKDILKIVTGISKKFPNYLANQIDRAALSIVLTIAEGSGKGSDKDFNRFILMAIGSVCEVAACIDVACDLSLISEKELSELTTKLESLRNQLGSFSKKLKAVG